MRGWKLAGDAFAAAAIVCYRNATRIRELIEADRIPLG